MESLQDRRVLVTGSSGFVGRYVLQVLKASGCYTIGLDNRATPQNPDSLDEHYLVDLRNKSELELVLEQARPAAVVHLAAVHYIPYCNRHPTETFDVNVQGTANLLEVLRKLGGIERFFLASSAAVYSPSETPHSEGDATWPTDIYGFSKRAAEYLVESWQEMTGVPVVIGRYFNMYGWGETSPHIIPVLIKAIEEHKHTVTLGNVIARRDYVSVMDNATATVKLLTAKLPWTYTVVNLGSGSSYSVLDLLGMLGKITSQPLLYEIDTRRMRRNDRPQLCSNMSRFYELGLDMPAYDIYHGLKDLVETGNGPFVNWDAV